eukprot:12428391-Karenia_brevis.AAC.1
MGVTQMHLKDMQWQARWCNGTLRLRDHEGPVWRPNPEYGMGRLRTMIEEARINFVWAEATTHRHGT